MHVEVALKLQEEMFCTPLKIGSAKRRGFCTSRQNWAEGSHNHFMAIFGTGSRLFVMMEVSSGGRYSILLARRGTESRPSRDSSAAYLSMQRVRYLGPASHQGQLLAY